MVSLAPPCGDFASCFWQFGSKNSFFAGSLGPASQGCCIQCDAASAIAVSHDPGLKKLKALKASGQSLPV